ncbi:gamma-glutamylcyclotransferase [Microbacterium fluvii]|uniref:Gamma-glutamylcyclotransferase n=1 Tax=Microbacterium fluvii TaxID=415215 RepID=A0ABW2HBX8_9MICO|nr:gamma-glutamylcyclotransferase [Microbacterium fluvii]MCU4672450.1 gamma-glutamylcyclotransferase [Microbacterium fluvii]
MSTTADQLLFSYGALLGDDLRRLTFGRIIATEAAVLTGYTVDYVEVEDTRFGELTGLASHPMLRRTGNSHDKVVGELLLLTEQELDAADQFEMSLFRRGTVTLDSGREAWAYFSSR